MKHDSLWSAPAGLAARFASVAALTIAVSSCGGGGGDTVVAVPTLPIAVTRIGFTDVLVEWSDDPFADFFVITRNGAEFVETNALAIVDHAVEPYGRYCYHVAGVTADGFLTSSSVLGCIDIVP